MKFFIPENEISFEYSRSSGSGGQNINKISSRVQLRWPVGASAVFSPEQKEIIRSGLRNRLNKNDEVIIAAEDERSQLQNKQKAIKRFYELLNKVLTPRKKRKPTKPTVASKLRRLEEKTKLSLKKKSRRKADFEL